VALKGICLTVLFTLQNNTTAQRLEWFRQERWFRGAMCWAGGKKRNA